jgi:hypothetical protein
MPFYILAQCSVISGHQFRGNIPSYRTHGISLDCHVGVKLCETGTYSTVAEDSSLWAYDAVWLDKQFLTYQRILVPSSLWLSSPRQTA